LGSLSPWHWAIVAVVVIVLFGSKKLPDAARSLGKSLRIFKSEVRELQNEGKPDAGVGPAPQASAVPPATSVPSERVDRAGPEQDPTDARPA